MCTATCVQLHKRAEKIAAALMERSGINIGENVVLLYPPGNIQDVLFGMPTAFLCYTILV